MNNENQQLEFKQVWRDDYLKTICAFANGEGGQAQNKYGKTWDDIAEDRFALTDICSETIEKLKRLAADRVPDIADEKDTETLLRKLNLYDGDQLKRAAVLLFGKNPQQFYIQSHSKVGRFLSETDIQSSDIIEGNLINQVDLIMDVLRLKYRRAYISYEGMHRRETLEYPYDALREAIINALIHRDYTDTSNLQICVYDDKLVMYNGATLSREVPIELFDQPHQSKPFNPTMAAVFYKCGYIENWGRGTLNIIDYCLQAGLPKPEFAYQWGAVRTTFFKKEQITPSLTAPESGHVGVFEGVSEGVNEATAALLALIEQSPGHRTPYFAKRMDTSVKNIERWLKQLRDQGLVEFRGAPKTGGYFALTAHSPHPNSKP